MIIINGNSLNLNDFIKVVRFNEVVALDKQAIEKVNQSHQKINNLIENSKIVYGVNTGFGKLSDVLIPKEDLSLLQENLLKSHACGVGSHFNKEIVRGIMLLRINALAKGFSGIRLVVVEKLVELLNKDIIPAIPCQGSLGASGDLAPLAHMALPLIGLGEVYYQGILMKSFDALKKADIKPIDRLVAKEGLSLINGTQAMTSVGAITLFDAFNLVKHANLACSLTLEAIYGIKEAFDEELHQARGQIGQIKCAEDIRKLTKNSTYLSNQGDLRVQDAYSIRCSSQVHGATLDALNYCLEKIEIEMNAATDNPLIFDSVISGGNFHGQVMANAFDFMKIVISEIANISERRIERLVNPSLSFGLPAFLVANPGINSGFMILQYSAASLVSENKVLAHPASVDSIPSSANQEDHVSMGTIAARGAYDILRNTQRVVAMEFMSSCQAIDLRPKKSLGEGTNLAYNYIRKHIPFIANDTIMYPYIDQIYEIVRKNEIINLIESSLLDS